jgi:hypothetical protein
VVDTFEGLRAFDGEEIGDGFDDTDDVFVSIGMIADGAWIAFCEIAADGTESDAIDEVS